MPTLKELSAEYDALKAEKENDDAALEELKPQLTTLNHIKYNFDVLERDSCQKRKIFAGKSIKNDNMAPVSGLLLRRKLAQGPFFFCIWGEAKRSDDAGKRHNHRA